jgi:hypothetical protein
MKKTLFLTILLALTVWTSCKDDVVDRYDLLTDPVWRTDSLLANGVDASDPGELLFKFKGDARFNKDATGTFGIYKGTWAFAENMTQIVIKTDSLPLPLTCKIEVLDETSFKITTAVPDVLNPLQDIKIRMTFLPK